MKIVLLGSTQRTVRELATFLTLTFDAAIVVAVPLDERACGADHGILHRTGGADVAIVDLDNEPSAMLALTRQLHSLTRPPRIILIGTRIRDATAGHPEASDARARVDKISGPEALIAAVRDAFGSEVGPGEA